jgi:hypothetical protein
MVLPPIRKKQSEASIMQKEPQVFISRIKSVHKSRVDAHGICLDSLLSPRTAELRRRRHASPANHAPAARRRIFGTVPTAESHTVAATSRPESCRRARILAPPHLPPGVEDDHAQLPSVLLLSSARPPQSSPRNATLHCHHG